MIAPAERIPFRRDESDFYDAAGLLRSGHAEPDVQAWTFLTARQMAKARREVGSAERIPSPEEITAKAARIREGWTAKERRSRRFDGRERWMLPGLYGGLRDYSEA